MSEYKLQYTAKQINERLSMATIRGSGAPTISTEGAVGCFYMNTDNGDVYKCVSVANGMFVWVNADNTVSDAVKYTAQTLTEEQKTQVRKNIGASTVEEVINVIDPEMSEDLLTGVSWTSGYVSAYSGMIEGTDREIQTYADACIADIIPIESGVTYVFTYAPVAMRDAGPWWAVQNFDENQVFVNRVLLDTTNVKYNNGVPMYTAEYTPADGVCYFRMSGRTFAWYNDHTKTREEMNTLAAELGPTVFTMRKKVSNRKLLPDVNEDDTGKILRVENGVWAISDDAPDTELSIVSGNTVKNVSVTNALRMLSLTDNVKAIAHRGYSAECPENTLHAYTLARRKGFRYAECDVSFTSDGVAVLLHDTTIDRTSNGTGAISEMTYDTVRALDFGSWFSDDFAGTTIPSFEEFIILCRKTGLHPYIELKPSGATQERISNLVDVVFRAGMRGKVSWISFYQNLLEYVKSADDEARLGFIINEFGDTTIATCESLKTDKNEVFLDAPSATTATVDACVTAKIPLELWTINSEQTIVNMSPYVTGVTSDMVHAGQVLFDSAFNI